MAKYKLSEEARMAIRLGQLRRRKREARERLRNKLAAKELASIPSKRGRPRKVAQEQGGAKHANSIRRVIYECGCEKQTPENGQVWLRPCTNHYAPVMEAIEG